MKEKLQKMVIAVLLVGAGWFVGYSQAYFKYEKEMLVVNKAWMDIHDTDMKRLDYEEKRNMDTNYYPPVNGTNHYIAPVTSGPTENLS